MLRLFKVEQERLHNFRFSFLREQLVQRVQQARQAPLVQRVQLELVQRAQLDLPGLPAQQGQRDLPAQQGQQAHKGCKV